MSQLNILEYKNKYRNRTVFILGTGPSLTELNPNQLEKVKEQNNCMVFAIKQSYNYCPGIADFHFLNSANISNYNYSQPIPIFLELASNELDWKEIIPHHFLFVVKQNWDFTQSLSATHDFDSVSIENHPDSLVFGPGILWELCLPMVLFMGFSHIVTLGVDLGASGEVARSHFYGQGNRVNPLSHDETSKEVELSGAYYDYLQRRGVNWTILSQKSYLHSKIPRYQLGQ